MSSNRKAKKPSFDNDQKKELKQHAIGLMRGLLQGAIRVGDPKPFDFGELGGTFFEGFTARFTPCLLRPTSSASFLTWQGENWERNGKWPCRADLYSQSST
ncbi:MULTISPECIES: hypothetical protein [Mesorhizobium]|uniref:hypothetical protein n=1 Tax=Mesorhizobium TaxID=68287 RepID=UPI003757A7E6